VNLEEILAIIERIGSDNAPTSAELATARTELARAIHGEARSEAPDLQVLTTLRAAFSQAGTALAEAEAAEAAEAAQVAELLADIEDPDGEEAPAVEAGEETPPAEELPPVEGELPAPAAGEQPAEEPVPVAAGAAAPVPMLSLRDAASRIRVRPPAPEAPAPTGTPGASIFVGGVQVDHTPDIREVAAAFERAVRSPNTGKQTLVRFDTFLDEDRTLPGDTAGNTAMLDRWVGPEAVAAAGGCCSLPTPIRTQNVMSSTARPIRDSLPTIGVQNTGAVMYFPAVCLPADGAAVWLCSDDSAVDPDDPETWKECVFIDCPTEDRTIVDAIYRCLTIGEFQRRFATEQWVAILQATLALQARIADLKLWSDMLAGVSTTHTAATTGSIFNNWANATLLAADTIRDDQRYDGVQINQWLPRWFRGAVLTDLVNRRLADTNNPAVADAFINEVAATAGVNINWTMDPDPVEPGDQADGPLTPYPETISTIIAPEGYYSFLDGGQFDLGIEIRDLDLARQNAVGAFAEGFEGILARGCNAKRINIPVEICETAAGCAVA
jgi:hypothetical protein